MYAIAALGALGYLVARADGAALGILAGSAVAFGWAYLREQYEIRNQHAERNALALQIELALERQISKGFSEFMTAAEQERKAAISHNDFEAEFGNGGGRVPIPW